MNRSNNPQMYIEDNYNELGDNMKKLAEILICKYLERNV